jgi:ATP-binding cassette subfamily F protein uup
MLNDEALANARADKLLAQEEVWIRKGVEARRTRSEGRVQRLERLRRERAARRERQGKVDFRTGARRERQAGGGARTRQQALYGDKTVVRDFSCRIQRGDKIGLIGPTAPARPRCCA